MKSKSLLFCLLFNFLVLGQYDAPTQRAIDSLKLVAETHPDDSVRLEAYSAWDEIIYLAEPDLDYEINEKVIAICDQNISDKKLSPTRRLFFYRQKASSKNIHGLYFNDKGNYNKAHELFEQSLEIGEILNDSMIISMAMNNLGMVYKYQEYPELALKYYEKSLEMEPNSDLRSFAATYNNMGLCYFDMDKNQLAIEFYRKSLSLSRQADDKYNESNVLLNIGELFFNQNNLDSALSYFQNSYHINKEIDYVSGLVYSLEQIGRVYGEMGQVNKSIAYCSQALEMVEEAEQLNNEARCHNCLYKAYKVKGNEIRALYHLEKYKLLEDSVKNQKEVELAVQEQYQKEYEQKRLSDSLEISNQQRIKEVQLQADIDKGKIQRVVLFIGLGAFFIIILLVFRSYRSKKKDNEIITSQKKIVEEKNQEITDSITYAKRIQTAILPSPDFVQKHLPHSFILYKPKDIVAGDFYWMEEVDGRIFLAVADCTGHGVPGAMVSVVCHNALNRSVREFKLKSPGDILDKTRQLVIETFEKSAEDVKDGMDISLMSWNKGEETVQYAGANNSIYIIRSKEKPILEEIKPDKQPIGLYDSKKPFSTHTISLEKGDVIYAFTDGYPDQFGGPKGKKFKYKQLKNKCLELYNLPFDQQKNTLEKTFIDWKGELEQIDDVCILGMSLN